MSENSRASESVEAPHQPDRSKRSLRIVFCTIAAGMTLWQVICTEIRVAELRAQGFTDVAISSTRDHAYLPLIGGYVGAILFLAIGFAIKKCLRKIRG